MLAEPAPGDLVMVRPSIPRPRYDWDSVPPCAVGTLVDVTPETSDCLIDFSWKIYLKERPGGFTEVLDETNITYRKEYRAWHGHLADLQRVTVSGDVPRVGA